MSRMPVIFLPHGGGPWPFVPLGLPPEELAQLGGFLRRLPALVPEPPRALLVVSAHWEARLPTVQAAARPPLLFDYYGFPEASYRLRWDAPGDPGLAARVRELLAAAGLASSEDRERGFDHGAFVPLKVAWPGAEVPTVQLSLVQGLDPAGHLALGRAIAPLRDEGVLIVGSGMSFHNLPVLFGRRPGALAEAWAFDAWLRQTMQAPEAERTAGLLHWDRAPAARWSHPREEHLLPLHVVAGAAGADRGTVLFGGTFARYPVLAVGFGALETGALAA